MTSVNLISCSTPSIISSNVEFPPSAPCSSVASSSSDMPISSTPPIGFQIPESLQKQLEILYKIKIEYEELDIQKDRAEDSDTENSEEIIERIESKQDSLKDEIENKEHEIVNIWSISLIEHIKNSYSMKEFYVDHGMEHLRIISNLSFSNRPIEERSILIQKEINEKKLIIENTSKQIIKIQDLVFSLRKDIFSFFSCSTMQPCTSWELTLFEADKHGNRFPPTKVSFKLPNQPNLDIVIKNRSGAVDMVVSDYLNQINAIHPSSRKVHGGLYGIKIYEFPAFNCFISEYIEGTTPILSAAYDLEQRIARIFNLSNQKLQKIKSELLNISNSIETPSNQKIYVDSLLRELASLESTHTYTGMIGGGDYHFENVKIKDNTVVIFDLEVATGKARESPLDLEQTLLYQHCENLMPPFIPVNEFSPTEQQIIIETQNTLRKTEVRFLPISTTDRC